MIEKQFQSNVQSLFQTCMLIDIPFQAIYVNSEW